MRNVYSLKQASQILDISEATLRNWIKAGIISANRGENADVLIQKSDLNDVLEKINNNSLEKLKSRRNRSKSSMICISKNYIGQCEAYTVGKEILKLATQIDLSEYDIKQIISNYFKKAFAQIKSKKNHETFKLLLNELEIYDDSFENERLKKINSFSIPDIRGIDFLGLLYMSLLSTSKKSKAGSYYTPINIVYKMIQNLSEKCRCLADKIVWDPCCGTGNFLISLNLKGIPINQLYGSDLDKTSVTICRMNLFLMNPLSDYQLLCSHFDCRDSLVSFDRKVDVIIGNPPWGATLNKDSILNFCYETYSNSADSFDLFLEQSLKSLNNQGISYLLTPEALLSVSIHSLTRQYLINNSKLLMANLWGHIFDHVQTNVVSLMLQKEKSNSFFEKAQVISSNCDYCISPSRKFDQDNWNFATSDNEESLLRKIESIDACYLKGNADFALGIVTGNNAKFLKKSKENNECNVLRGSDLHRFVYDEPQQFMSFTPDKFQQVAPEKYYFAKEKLLYRFIGNSLVFSYDCNQTLSLNSANIVIPRLKDFNIKYILAILNSDVANFYWKMKFHSIKILRSQIESIPIPLVSFEKQMEIVMHVDNILNRKAIKMEEEIVNKLIYRLYDLNDLDIKTIKTSVNALK